MSRDGRARVNLPSAMIVPIGGLVANGLLALGSYGIAGAVVGRSPVARASAADADVGPAADAFGVHHPSWAITSDGVQP